MADATLQLGAIDSPHRENFSPLRTVFFVLIHLGALAVFWQTTWGAILVVSACTFFAAASAFACTTAC